MTELLPDGDHSTLSCPHSFKSDRLLGGIALLKLNGGCVLLIESSPSLCLVFRNAGFAFFGGLLGGVLFDMKWLYHSVAHGVWNQDRFLWRFFTPIISAGLSISFFILIKSGILTIVSQATIEKASSTVAISFLVGYFSDSALAKMYEIATTLFGTVSKDNGKK